MYDYRQSYLNSLINEIDETFQHEDSIIIGETSYDSLNPPHIGVFVQVSADVFLGSTIGLADRMPLPVQNGFQYFEMCAISAIHSPSILHYLSKSGIGTLADMSPFSFGLPEEALKTIENSATNKEYHPFETVFFEEVEELLMIVPRWKVEIKDGPIIDIIEPLPVTTEWETLRNVSLSERPKWIQELGWNSRFLWQDFLDRLDQQLKRKSSA
jgi:hypothetical protein